MNVQQTFLQRGLDCMRSAKQAVLKYEKYQRSLKRAKDDLYFAYVAYL